eukprot:SAG31_NODE_12_length_38498_cov_21.161671_3_plen_274_part_00
MQPLLAQWMLLWLRQKRVKDISDEHLLQYLMKGPSSDQVTISAVMDSLSDEHVKMVNLTHDWLSSFGPFVLSKIDRVNFGLLTADQYKQMLAENPKMPSSRSLVAVPFVGKDVPTRASEFSHPDVVMGLTILAYRYEGLRMTDFMQKLTDLREEMQDEVGPYHKRAACLKFQEWVEAAGGRVRGTRLQSKTTIDEAVDAVHQEDATTTALIPKYDSIWPLQLLDLHDPEQVDLLCACKSDPIFAAVCAAPAFLTAIWFLQHRRDAGIPTSIDI